MPMCGTSCAMPTSRPPGTLKPSTSTCRAPISFTNRSCRHECKSLWGRRIRPRCGDVVHAPDQRRAKKSGIELGLFSALWAYLAARVELPGSPQNRAIPKTKNRPRGPVFCLSSGGQGGNRTPDTGIFNPLLYQLSYLATFSALCREELRIKPSKAAFVKTKSG